MSRAELLDCGHAESPHSDITRGYATMADGTRHCYDCCARMDRETMRATGAITLYLTKDEVTNWPGSLRFPARGVRKSARGGGFGSQRTDAWFIFEGFVWHCVNRGDMQIARCKRTKERLTATA